MNMIKKVFTCLYILFFFIESTHPSYNLTIKITNDTSFPCNFTDGTNTPIPVAAGETLFYDFKSSPLSYTFGPSIPHYKPTIANGNIYYSTNNYLYLSSDSTPYYTNKAGFQLHVKYNDNSTTILNNNGSIVQNIPITYIKAQPFSSGLISSAPSSANYSIDQTGAIIEITSNITNNSDNTITNLVFKDANKENIKLLNSLYNYSSTSIPNNATSLECICNKLNATLVHIPIFPEVSSNIYGAGSITNLSDTTVYVTYSNQYNTTYNSSPIPLAKNEELLILSTASSVNISSSNIKNNRNILLNQTINPNKNSYLTCTNGIWNLSTNSPINPTFTANKDTNNIQVTRKKGSKIFYNYDQPTSIIYCTDVLTGVTSSVNSLSAWNSANIPANTTSLYCTGLANGGNATIDPNITYDIYSNFVITNRTNDTILLQYTTSGGTGSCSIYPQQSLPIISNTTNLEIFVNGVSKALTNISENSSYLITYTDPDYFINPYTPVLENNYAVEITDLNFYNSNNTLIDSFSSINPDQTNKISATSSFATFKIPQISSSTMFTIPIRISETIHVVTENTITNNSGRNVQINYYGNYNLSTDTLLTNQPLSIINTQIIPITTGTLNIQVLDEFGIEVINTKDGGLLPGLDYYILYDNNTWTLSSTPVGTMYYLTNNSNIPTGTIIFYDNSGTQIDATNSIPAYSYYPIPTTTKKINCSGLLYNSSCTIYATENININIYSNYALTNNTDFDIFVTYYGIENNVSVVNGTIKIPSRISVTQPTYAPIVTGITAISTLNIPKQNILNSTSYIITFENSIWSMNAYTPTFNNNSIQNGTNLTFYNSNGSKIFSNNPSTLPALGTAEVPISAAYISLNIYDTTINLPTTLAPNSYLFTNNVFTNLTNKTLGISLYGNQLLNSPDMKIQSGGDSPIITTATSVTIDDGGWIVIPRTTLVENTSYFINYNSFTDTWWLSVNTTTSNATLTNNYNQNATNLTFWTKDSVQTGPEISPFQAWASTTIPSNAWLARFTSLESNIELYTAPETQTNIFTPFVIKNNTSKNIALWFYNPDNNYISLNPGIITRPGTATPIITYTNTVAVTNAVYVDGVPTEIYIPATPIVSNSSYYVMYDETTDTWSLVQTLPTENNYLTNNYDGTATNLAFLNANNTQQGTTQQTMSAHTSTLIPSTSTKAQYSYFNSNMTIEINDATSTGIFTNNYLINNAEQTISAIYYGSSQQPITDPVSSTYASNNMPIITSAAYFSILDANGIEQISQQPITVGTDYIIDNTWTITPITPERLTNNSGQDAANLIFYNVNTPVGTTINPFYNQTAINVPTNATMATTIETFNTINSTLTVSVDDSVSSNLVTEYKLHNNSGSSVTVNFFGTINNIQNQLLNTPEISIPAFNVIPIMTGVDNISVIVNNSIVITHTTINPQADYYINYINEQWSLDTYESIAHTYNNSITDASNLIFYDVHNTILTTDTNFNAYTSQATPINTVYASADFQTPFESTITVPITGQSTCQFFNTTKSIISNNTSAVPQSVHVIFHGTLNNIPNSNLNNPALNMPINASLPIVTGVENVSVVDATDNNIIYIANYPIETNQSYAITNYYNIYGDLTWTINKNAYTATLNNNYNQEGNNLKFFDSDSQLNITQTTFPAYSSAGIPTNSTISEFNVFNSILRFPVSSTASSSVYGNVLYNKTGQTISVSCYGTINGIDNILLNNPALNCANEDMIPFLMATDYMIINSQSNSLDTRTTPYNQLPKVLAYDIVYNPYLNIIPHQLHVTNNFYQTAQTVDFYDINKNFISRIDNIAPFATTTIPSNPQATSAIIVYDDYSVTIPLSTSLSSSVFRNTILTNNTNNDVMIMFFDKEGNSLHTKQIALPIGSFIPYITGTEQVTVITNDTVIIANQLISPAESYQIKEENNFQFSLANNNAQLTQASSALGAIRILGGSQPTQSSEPTIKMYGKNTKRFKEFLYIETYAKIITDIAARNATIGTCNSIVDQYGIDNRNNDFNYISYLYLIKNKLRAAQLVLQNQYPNSVQQINMFFRYLFKHNDMLLE